MAYDQHKGPDTSNSPRGRGSTGELAAVIPSANGPTVEAGMIACGSMACVNKTYGTRNVKGSVVPLSHRVHFKCCFEQQETCAIQCRCEWCLDTITMLYESREAVERQAREQSAKAQQQREAEEPKVKSELIAWAYFAAAIVTILVIVGTIKEQDPRLLIVAAPFIVGAIGFHWFTKHTKALAELPTEKEAKHVLANPAARLTITRNSRNNCQHTLIDYTILE